jgi:hypothetical protein
MVPDLGFFIGAFAMATQDTSFSIPAGWVGLALNYSIELTGYLKFGVRMVRGQIMIRRIGRCNQTNRALIFVVFFFIDRPNGGGYEFG